MAQAKTIVAWTGSIIAIIGVVKALVEFYPQLASSQLVRDIAVAFESPKSCVRIMKSIEHGDRTIACAGAESGYCWARQDPKRYPYYTLGFIGGQDDKILKCGPSTRDVRGEGSRYPPENSEFQSVYRSNLLKPKSGGIPNASGCVTRSVGPFTLAVSKTSQDDWCGVYEFVCTKYEDKKIGVLA
jgi:hypothetical protein